MVTTRKFDIHKNEIGPDQTPLTKTNLKWTRTSMYDLRQFPLKLSGEKLPDIGLDNDFWMGHQEHKEQNRK